MLEAEHPGVMFYAKCHTSYAPERDTLLTLAVGDLVAVVKEKAETGWCVVFWPNRPMELCSHRD